MATKQSSVTPPINAPEPQRKRPRWGALWSNFNFMTFWMGETVSVFGSQVTALALPLTAVLALNANAQELGLLRFLETAPVLFFPLLFGVWVDRRRRRPLMLLANSMRAVLIGLIPLLTLWHQLHLLPLYLIAFCVGTFTVLFDLCWFSFVPTLVAQEHLIEANGTVGTSYTAAEVAGPGLAGVLVQWFTAPMALLADSLSYVVSVISLLLIGAHEPAPERKQQSRLFQDIGEGLRFAFSNALLKMGAILAASWNFCINLLETTFLLYAVRQLHFNPGLLGLIYAASAVGGVVGSAFASTLARRFRLGFVFSAFFVLAVVPAFLLPAATGPLPLVVVMCITGSFLYRTALGVWTVMSTSLRQAIIANQMRGRVQASIRMISYGGVALGMLAAGVLGTAFGLHFTLWVACCGLLLTFLPYFLSPYPRLRGMSDLTPTERESSDGMGE